jgi:hypothetical protein
VKRAAALVRHSRIHPSGWWGRPRAIVRRGPDEQDVYESQNVSREPVQLKIVHLAAWKQPMRTENDNTIFVLNGKIQNRQELRWELEQALYTFNCCTWYGSGSACLPGLGRQKSREASSENFPALKGLRWSNAAGCCAYVGLQEREHTRKSQCEPRVTLLVE